MEGVVSGEDEGETGRSVGNTFIEGVGGGGEEGGGGRGGGEGGGIREGGDTLCGHSLFVIFLKTPRGLSGGVNDFLSSTFFLFVRNELQRRLILLDFLSNKGEEGEERQVLSSGALPAASNSVVIEGVSGV